MTISSGGVAFNTLVGGKASFEAVYAGGITSDTLVSGSFEYLEGGQSSGTVVESGKTYGFQDVYSGTANSTIVDSLGYQQVLGNQAYAVGTVVHSRGQVFVSAGGTLENCTIDGGTVTVASSGLATGDITFSAGGGTLEINTQDLPSATISGFAAGDQIILDGTSSNSGTVSVNAPGVVTVSAGGSEYNLNIAGATVGETDFVFSDVTLTKTDTAQMRFVRPPVSPSAGLDASATPSNFKVTAADFAPKIFGGIQLVASSSHFGWPRAEEARPPQTVIPVSMTHSF